MRRLCVAVMNIKKHIVRKLLLFLFLIHLHAIISKANIEENIERRIKIINSFGE